MKGLVFGFIIAGSLLLIAAKPVPSGTFALVEPGPYHLGDTVHFSWSADLKPSQNPRIQVVCFKGSQVVYGEAQDAQGNAFVLGGGWSDWRDVGGPADCIATLYFWDFHPTQTFNPLAPPIGFHAEGAN